MGHSRTPTQNTAGDEFPTDPIDGSGAGRDAAADDRSGGLSTARGGAVLARPDPLDRRRSVGAIMARSHTSIASGHAARSSRVFATVARPRSHVRVGPTLA